MRRFFLAAVLAGLALSASALPTVDDVQAEVAKGNYSHAEEMMREVVAAKPGSARAHYVYAEILARDRRFDQAAEQAARAKSIDPTLKFTQPETFRAFEQLLEREQAAGRRPVVSERAPATGLREPAPVESSGGVPGWAWGLGLAGLALVAWRALGAKRQANVAPPYTPAMASGTPAAAPMGGYGPAYPPAPAAGSGLLGTGLAVAGGVAAGMLAEKFLEGRHPSNSGQLFPDASRGLGAGLFDDPSGGDAAARELEQRQVDFGNGDGWGSGDAGGGDSSSSGGDGGW
jgi:tetratricopeptide (TPR) repeat protein